MAFEQIEPDEMIRIREILKLGFCALVNAFGGRIDPEDLDPQMLKEREDKPFDDVAWAAAFMGSYGVDINAADAKDET